MNIYLILSNVVLVEEGTYGGCDFRMVTFKGEVATVYIFHHGLRKVSLKSFGSCGDKARIVLAPDGEKRWPVLAQVGLHGGIKFYIVLIVKDEVVLLIFASGKLHIGIVQGITVGADAAFGCSTYVLSLNGFVGRRPRRIACAIPAWDVPNIWHALPIFSLSLLCNSCHFAR